MADETEWVYGGGYIPDNPDTRDKSANLLLTRAETPGEEVNWEEHTPEPLDQVWTSSCVGQSGAGAFATRASVQSEGAKKFLPSPQWMYDIARLIGGTHHEDRGAQIRNLMKAITRYGVVPWDVMPFNPDKINESPPWDAFRHAFDQRMLQGYYRVDSIGDSRIADLKQALHEGHIPVFGMQVSQSFVDYTGGVIAEMLGKVLGGHAMFLYGFFRDEFFNGQNSWSKGWGENGRYRISQNLIHQARDIWIFQTVPEYSEAA